MPEHYLTIGAVFRQETKWLREWIEYHRLVGVGHFYLLNNDYADPDHEEYRRSEAVLAPYVEGGVVTAYPWDWDHGSVQAEGYEFLAATYAPWCAWMAFLDLDEFFLPLADLALPPLLKRYERHEGLAVGLATFGTSGQAKSPRLQTEAFYRRAYDNRPCNYTVKYVIRGGLGRLGLRERVFVDERHEPRDPLGKLPTPEAEVFRVNHYATRSEEDWEAKVRRGWPQGRPGGDLGPAQWWQKRNMADHDDVFDRRIWDVYGPRLCAALDLPYEPDADRPPPQVA